MPQKLLLASFHIVHHRELYAWVVDLLEADNHPKEVRKRPSQFGKVSPVFKYLSAVVGLLELAVVNLHDFMLHLQVHF